MGWWGGERRGKWMDVSIVEEEEEEKKKTVAGWLAELEQQQQQHPISRVANLTHTRLCSPITIVTRARLFAIPFSLVQRESSGPPHTTCRTITTLDLNPNSIISK